MSQHSVELVARLRIRFSSVFLTALHSLAMPSSCRAFSLLLKLELQLLCTTRLVQSSQSTSAFGVCIELFQQGNSPGIHIPGNVCGRLGSI